MKPRFKETIRLAAVLLLTAVGIPLTVSCGSDGGDQGYLRRANAELMFVTRGYLEGNIGTVG